MIIIDKLNITIVVRLMLTIFVAGIIIVMEINKDNRAGGINFKKVTHITGISKHVYL